MKRSLVTSCLLLALGTLARGAITTNLVIVGTAPSVELGTFSILDYTITSSGTLDLNHAFSNSGGAGVAAWGDALDFTGATGLTTGANTTFGIRIYGVSPTGVDTRIYSNSGLGMGVSGGSAGKLDWLWSSSNSEGLRFEINTTGLPNTVKLVITSLQFGNANAVASVQPEAKVDTLVNVTGYSGSLGTIQTATNNLDFNIPGGGISIAGGGGTSTTGSFVISQATKPSGGTGNVGFNLQGITFDVVAVPEPATVAIFAGVAAIGLVLWRRRAIKNV